MNYIHTYNIHIWEREKEVSYYVSLINIMLFNLKSNEKFTVLTMN